jgi:hypothetical protein
LAWVDTGTPLVKFRDIVALLIGALAVQLIAYGLSQSFDASPFTTAMFAGTVAASAAQSLSKIATRVSYR